MKSQVENAVKERECLTPLSHHKQLYYWLLRVGVIITPTLNAKNQFANALPKLVLQLFDTSYCFHLLYFTGKVNIVSDALACITGALRAKRGESGILCAGKEQEETFYNDTNSK